MSQRAFRAVTFDFGGVLWGRPESARNRKWEKRFGLPEGGLFQVLYDNPVAQQALIGQATYEEMMAEARRRLALTPDEWETFQADRREGQVWDTELLAFIRQLRPKYKTGVVSNATPGTHEQVKAYINNETFDVIVFSDQEGVSKPDPEIYRRALSRLGVAAEETIYVDDHLPNVEAARSLGIHAIYHTGSVEVQEAVKHLLSPRPARN
jgi:putative hydrolase of the HAD superfamily